MRKIEKNPHMRPTSTLELTLVSELLLKCADQLVCKVLHDSSKSLTSAQTMQAWCNDLCSKMMQKMASNNPTPDQRNRNSGVVWT